MDEAERIAVDMIRRYGSRDFTDEERTFWRAILVELRWYGQGSATSLLGA
jgi:hypothetical protein